MDHEEKAWTTRDSLRFKKDLLFRERRLLAEEMRKHDDQINFTRNFCIPTLIGLVGYILTRVTMDPVCENISYKGPRFVLFLPIAIVIFFAINEGIIQYWKWGAIMRLYKIGEALGELWEKGNMECIAEFRPEIISKDLKKKLKKQVPGSNKEKKETGSSGGSESNPSPFSTNECDPSEETKWESNSIFGFIFGKKWTVISNTIFAWNYGLFYLLLLTFCLLLLWKLDPGLFVGWALVKSLLKLDPGLFVGWALVILAILIGIVLWIQAQICRYWWLGQNQSENVDDSVSVKNASGLEQDVSRLVREADKLVKRAGELVREADSLVRDASELTKGTRSEEKTNKSLEKSNEPRENADNSGKSGEHR